METGRLKYKRHSGLHHLGNLINGLVNESGLAEKNMVTYMGVNGIKLSELLKHNIYN